MSPSIFLAHAFASVVFGKVPLRGGWPSRRIYTLCRPDFNLRMVAMCERPVNVARRNRLQIPIFHRGGGGRNRTGIHGFAGLGWILLNQIFSAISLSPLPAF